MKFILFLLSLLILSLPAGAGETPDFIKDDMKSVKSKMEAIKTILHKGKKGNDEFITKEDVANAPNPVIPFVDGKRVVNRGILTGMAEACGMDWGELSFIPFMQKERSTGRWDDIQIAYIGMLHGVTQASFASSFKENGVCNNKSKVEKLVLNAKP